MSLTTVTYSCDHTHNTDVADSFTGAERLKRLDWLSKKPCYACFLAQQEANIAEMTVGWPALTGTDKQIGWASKIRAAKIQLAAAADSGMGDTRSSLLALSYRDQAAAKWWIDNRERKPSGDADELMGKERKPRQSKAVPEPSRPQNDWTDDDGY
jgi:hypothetical protein